MPRWSSIAMLMTLLAGATSIAGCVDHDGPPHDACVASAPQSLTMGVIEAPIALTAAEIAAVGAIVAQEGELICSGVLVAERWVVSARHCVQSLPGGAFFRFGLPEQIVRVPIIDAFPNPRHDIALVEVSASSEVRAGRVTPLALELDAPLAIGDRLTLSGYGDPEALRRGTPLFLEETVVDLDDTLVRVEGEAGQGACHGDSGGPLLRARADQRAGIVGVLSFGATDCVGRDTYVRTSAVEDWIEETQEQRSVDPCADLTWEGECTSTGASWCEMGYPEVAICAGKDICGWDAEAEGYRCVNDEHDGCRGIGTATVCDGHQLMRCDRGNLITVDCTACGLECAYDSEGMAACE